MLSISEHLPLTAFQPMAVEPSPIRGLDADCPFFVHKNKHLEVSALHFEYLGFNHIFIYLIFSTFVTFTHSYISYLRCSLNSFRISQQLKEIHYILSEYSGLKIFNLFDYQAILYIYLSNQIDYRVRLQFLPGLNLSGPAFRLQQPI